MANQYQALLKYLNLTRTSKLSNYNKKDDIKNYIPKYLVYTWIAELLIEQENNLEKNNELKNF